MKQRTMASKINRTSVSFYSRLEQTIAQYSRATTTEKALHQYYNGNIHISIADRISAFSIANGIFRGNK